MLTSVDITIPGSFSPEIELYEKSRRAYKIAQVLITISLKSSLL